jgi:hypothetical protein
MREIEFRGKRRDIGGEGMTKPEINRMYEKC